MRIDSKLLAIDPYGCGCTSCLTGSYKPLDRADDNDMQALLLGIIDDHTSTQFDITQQSDGTFHVTADAYDDYDQKRLALTFTVAKIAYPVTVDTYTLDIDMDTVVDNLVHLRR